MPPEEHRRDERHALMLRVDHPGGSELHDVTENLSAGGLFIRTDRALEVGSRLSLLVGFPGLLAPIEIEVEVVRVRAEAGGQPQGVAVRIPEDRDDERARLARVVAAAARPPPAAGRVFQLLVVEDNAAVEALYEQTLRQLQPPDAAQELAVSFARDGADGLARLSREPRVDLVIADLFMPRMDGFEMVARMRRDPALQEIPVVAISGGGAEARQRSLECGVDIYIRKPVKIHDILGTVRALLRLAR